MKSDLYYNAITMEFEDNSFQLPTNLSGECLEHVRSGTWKIGLVADNPDIENKSSDIFYMDAKDHAGQTYRKFRNKVPVTLYDNSQVEAHIIHWHETGKWFCVTFDSFWNQFDDEA